jgi:hypothetical protein
MYDTNATTYDTNAAMHDTNAVTPNTKLAMLGSNLIARSGKRRDA